MHCLCFSLILLTSTCLWLMTAVLPLVAASAVLPRGLFTSDEYLEILDVNTFHDSLRHGERAKLILFYAEWCAHCQRYAPVFEGFAEDVAGWHSALDVGVINCADSANTALCAENGILGYPTLKLYWIERGGKGSTEGKELDTREPSALEKVIVDFMETNIKKKGAPANYPELAPSSAKDIKGIWDSVPADTKQVFVVVEKPDSYVGRELILDFSSIKGAAAVRFVRGDGPEEIRNQDSVSLMLLERGVHPRVLLTEKDASKARPLFKEQLQKLGLRFEKPHRSSNKSTTEAPHYIIGNYSRVYLDDIEAGIVYTLKQEVALKKEISPRQLSIFRRFLQLMYENIDLPSRIRKFLENLRNEIDVSEPLKGADISVLLKSAETKEAYLSKNAEYIGCRGSIPGKRGYTCSLWTIFHYITVGSHQRYLRKELSNPNLAVLVIRDYVENFFSCSECVKHFKTMSANIESDLKSPNDSVLWLWRAHNQVNARTSGDMTEDPERPKVQFPPASLCPECHVGDSFDEKAVLEFLHRFYSSGNLVLSEHTRATGNAERYTESTANTKYFSGFDLTIFLVIYAVSITLLFVVFVAMVCRRRKGNSNKNFSFLH